MPVCLEMLRQAHAQMGMKDVGGLVCLFFCPNFTFVLTILLRGELVLAVFDTGNCFKMPSLVLVDSPIVQSFGAVATSLGRESQMAMGQKYRVPKKLYWLKEKKTKTGGFLRVFFLTHSQMGFSTYKTKVYRSSGVLQVQCNMSRRQLVLGDSPVVLVFANSMVCMSFP